MTKLRKILIVLMLALIFFLVAGCSSNKDLFIGTWSGKQASTKVDSKNALLNFNYWKVSPKKITLSVSTLKDDHGKTTRVFDESNTKSYDYTWKSEKEILIDNILYTVEANKKTLIVKNNDIEIDFERLD